MAESKAREFIDALHLLEDEGGLDRIVEMFAPDAELDNPTVRMPQGGQDGARSFWDTYRRTFKDIRSDFRLVLEGEDGAMLEWTSRGHAPDGSDVEYGGVSVLSFRGGKIASFRAYFDPRKLGAQLEPRARAA